MAQDANTQNDLSDLFQDLPKDPGASLEESADSPAEQKPAESFQKIEKLTGPVQENCFPNSSFDDLMSTADSEIAARFQSLFQKFYATQDPQERTDARGRLIPTFWNLAESLAKYCSSKKTIPAHLRNFFRFGVVDPKLISEEHRKFLASLFLTPETKDPIFYTDEWLHQVTSGKIAPSELDETQTVNQARFLKGNVKLDKIRSHLDMKLQAMEAYNIKITGKENSLIEAAQHLQQRTPDPELNNQRPPYERDHKKRLSDISTLIKDLSLLNHKLELSTNEYIRSMHQLKKLEHESSEEESTSFNQNIALSEMRIVRQMVKLCIGRSGNHFPFLSNPYFSGELINIGFRENIINILAEIEFLDNNVFTRTHRDVTTRIIPNILLVPSYGDLGICWSPFEKYSRGTSRGRVIIPMYPRNLKIAVTAAVADLRWQTAKEKSSRFWMEEGLTGWYYDYFSSNKLKGDIKQHFIRDYIFWIQKESEGTQKLSREVRSVFWRYIPFPQEIKDRLKNRGYVYQELHKKDVNKSRSSMY